MNTQSRIVAGIIALLVLLGIFVLVGSRWGIIEFKQGSIIPSISFGNPAGSKPSLDRPVHFPADFPADAQKIWTDNVAKTKASLEKNPNDLSAWFDLAIEYRQVGDQAGAVEIWNYISATHPNEAVSLHNLGEYNFHTAKNYPVAESYYRKSIAVAPQFPGNYSDLYEMYRYVYKQNTSAAADVLKEGIAHVPAGAGVDLMVTLATYYRDSGDKTNAITYFTQARAGASALHNAALVSQLDQQLKALGK